MMFRDVAIEGEGVYIHVLPDRFLFDQFEFDLKRNLSERTLNYALYL